MAGGNFSVNQPWMIVLALFFIIGAILFGVQAYFHSKEVHALRAGCFNQGGQPVVETTFLHLGGYSFACEPKADNP